MGPGRRALAALATLGALAWTLVVPLGVAPRLPFSPLHDNSPSYDTLLESQAVEVRAPLALSCCVRLASLAASIGLHPVGVMLRVCISRRVIFSRWLPTSKNESLRRHV